MSVVNMAMQNCALGREFCDRNQSAVSLNTPPDSVVWVPMLVRMAVHSLSMQFHSAMGL